MSCMILKLPEMMIGTAASVCAPCYEISLPIREEATADCGPVHSHWVEVADENGKRQLRMVWHPEHDDASQAGLENL